MLPVRFAGPLVLDEHCSYWIVDGPAGGTISNRSLGYAATPPLSSWVQSLSLSLLGKSEFTFRLPSVLAYLAAIGATFLLGSALDNRTTGGLAALLVAWHPDALQEVRLARPYGLLLLLSALLLWGSVRWSRLPVSRLGPAVTVLSAAALLWTHYVAALLVVAAGAVLLFSRGPDPFAPPLRRLHVTAAGLLIMVISLPLWPAVLRMLEWSPFLNYRTQDPGWADLISPVWRGAIPAGVILALLPVRRVRSEHVHRTRLVLTTAAWGLLPVLLLVLLARGDMTSLADPRYRVPFVVAGSCFITQFLQWRSPSRLWTTAACVLMLGSAWWMTGSRPWDPGRLGDPLGGEWRDLATRVEREGRTGEPLFVQGGLIEARLVPALSDDAAFLEYVACRASRFYLPSEHPRIGLPFLWNPQTGVTDVFRARLRTLPESGHESFWLACALDTDLNRNSWEGMQSLALQEGYTVIAQEQYPQTILQRYRRASEGAP